MSRGSLKDASFCWNNMGRHSKALFEEEGQLSHMQPARALSELGTDSLVFQEALTSVDV